MVGSVAAVAVVSRCVRVCAFALMCSAAYVLAHSFGAALGCVVQRKARLLLNGVGMKRGVAPQCASAKRVKPDQADEGALWLLVEWVVHYVFVQAHWKMTTGSWSGPWTQSKWLTLSCRSSRCTVTSRIV